MGAHNMFGTVDKVPKMEDSGKFKFFCFIRGDDKKDYFLHASDFTGDWFRDLCHVVRDIGPAKVEFETVQGPKGPRAANAKIAQ